MSKHINKAMLLVDGFLAQIQDALVHCEVGE
jgi:hypothetical protein